MKIRTSELNGKALNWAVANCDGRKIVCDPMGFGVKTANGGYWIWETVPSGKGGIDIHKSVQLKIGGAYSPSTNWAQGGPIIELAGIYLGPTNGGRAWCAQSDVRVFNAYGPTPLIAAMRCYVASKLGEIVDVPDQLIDIAETS